MLQKQLHLKDQMSVQESLDMCRVYKALIHHTSQLADIQDYKGKELLSTPQAIPNVDNVKGHISI